MDPTSEEIKTAEEAKAVEPSAAPPPKPRGKRRKGPAATSLDLGQLPDEIVEVVAIAPLILSGAIIKTVTTKKDANGKVVADGVTLTFDPGAAQATVAAFKNWLSTLDVEMTPGLALIACYVTTLASAMPDAVAQMQSRTEKQSKPVEVANVKTDGNERSVTPNPTSGV